MTLESALTVERIARLAGQQSYARGLGYAGRDRVEKTVRTGQRVEATVRGTLPYFVMLEAKGDDIAWSCTCPVGDRFCKHCVAVALTIVGDDALRLPGEPTTTERDRRRAVVAKLPKERLVELLVEQAEHDQVLWETIDTEQRVRSGATPDLKAWKSRITKAFQPRRRFIEYRDVPEWAAGVQELIDGLARLAELAPSDDVAKLIETAYGRSNKAIDYIDDSDGWLSSFSDQLAGLHERVCDQAGIDPVKLARRLVKLELESELDGFHHAALTHAAALGPGGLAEYRRLVEPQWNDAETESDTGWFGSSRVREAMVGIALAGGDPDELIRIRATGRRTLPRECLEIAETLVAADRIEEAELWCRRGLKAGEGRPYQTGEVRDLLATLLRDRGDDAAAAALFWDAFTESPGAESYRRFVSEQRTGDEATQRAIDWLRERIAQSPSGAGFAGPYTNALIEILLYEGTVDEAWQVASQHGASNRLWLTLAAAREKTHPEDAIPVYTRTAREQIATAKRNGYRQAVKGLRHVQTIASEEAFAGIIAAIRRDHGRKRTLMDMFTKEGW